jgi:tetratricopeptide (TPR) repeat protein
MQHPLANDSSHLRAWELEKRLSKRPAHEIMLEASHYFKDLDLARKALGARWLYAQGEAQMALDLANLPDALQNQDLFKVRMDALATLKQWPEANKELTTGSVPLPEPIVFLYRAEVARALGDSGSCAALWEEARNKAVMDPRMLGYLADYADKTGEWDEAKQGFKQIAQLPGLAPIGYRRLLEIESQHGTDPEIVGTLHDMMAQLPTNDEPKNDWAYLSLILNRDVQDAQAVAVRLVNANPSFLSYRTTLAVSYLSTNQPGRALDLYRNLTIDWPHAPNSYKMVYAVVLAANGCRPEAIATAKTVDRTALRPGERDFMTTYLP